VICPVMLVSLPKNRGTVHAEVGSAAGLTKCADAATARHRCLEKACDSLSYHKLFEKGGVCAYIIVAFFLSSQQRKLGFFVVFPLTCWLAEQKLRNE
jgi:hypothetical protein